jgi:DNA-binding SARP family transcriptional activator
MRLVGTAVPRVERAFETLVRLFRPKREARMDFRILGPLEVWDGERSVPVGGAKPRSLLAVLLLNANRVVSTTRLVDELWGERAPPTAEGQLVRGYVYELRKQLGADTLVTQPPGYRLPLDSHSLDLLEFERLVADARTASREQAVEGWRRALALWRGPPLLDVTLWGEARHEPARLAELRLAAQVELVDSELALGRHERLVGELEALVEAHPYQEPLHAQLMLALYRSGRQAEALAAYRTVRTALKDELGLQPGPALRELEAAILRQDEGLTLAGTDVEWRRHAASPARSAGPPGRERVGRQPPPADSAQAGFRGSQDVTAGERRVVSVLVADVAGSTDVTEQLGAARSKVMLDELAGLMREEVERFAGTVAQPTADGVLALFGAPVAHGDDCERAVRAALAIREAVDDYAADVGARLRHRAARPRCRRNRADGASRGRRLGGCSRPGAG